VPGSLIEADRRTGYGDGDGNGYGPEAAQHDRCRSYQTSAPPEPYSWQGAMMDRGAFRKPSRPEQETGEKCGLGGSYTGRAVWRVVKHVSQGKGPVRTP
jgi:hypothetical protein